MVKKREGNIVIFSDLANQRIKDNACPTCGKPKAEWSRRKDWRCCSLECTKRFWEEQVIVKSWQDLREKCFKSVLREMVGNVSSVESSQQH